MTYIVEGLLSVGLANTKVVCKPRELVTFNPINGTCQEYMADYISTSGGYLANPDATTGCQFCTVSLTNDFLKSVSASYTHRWRNFGILFAYLVFNIVGAIALYYIARVPKGQKEETEEHEKAREAKEHTQEKGSDKETR